MRNHFTDYVWFDCIGLVTKRWFARLIVGRRDKWTDFRHFATIIHALIAWIGLNWNEENSKEENNSWCMPWCMIMHDGHVICVHNPKPNNTYTCTCCACCVRCTCYTQYTVCSAFTTYSGSVLLKLHSRWLLSWMIPTENFSAPESKIIRHFGFVKYFHVHNII